MAQVNAGGHIASDMEQMLQAREELRHMEVRLIRQREALLTLTSAHAGECGELPAAIASILETCAWALGVSRVSIWRYDAERAAIRCIDLYDSAGGTHTSGLQLLARDFPRYFRAIADNDVVAVDDAEVDSRTVEFTSAYLRPLSIRSMLDVPLHLNGEFFGVICHEQVGHRRHWTADEKGFALAASALVSLAFERCERRRAEAQFLQAQKMELVGRLAGGIAHDFNNLLTVINGTTELALETLQPGDPSRTEFLRIRESAARAAALTRQLLAFSRKEVVHRQPVDVAKVVTDFRQMLQRLIGEDLKLDVRAGDGEAWVHADHGQLEQVLLNLAINARDAMPNGGRLGIAVDRAVLDGPFGPEYPSARPGPHVRIRVSDTGAGIPADVLPRIFEPFFTTKGVEKGTGLGLATVYAIVEQAHGAIIVESTEGIGTTFTVCLPELAVAPAPAMSEAFEEVLQ